MKLLPIPTPEEVSLWKFHPNWIAIHPRRPSHSEVFLSSKALLVPADKPLALILDGWLSGLVH
jgi:hypothetical protein